MGLSQGICTSFPHCLECASLIEHHGFLAYFSIYLLPLLHPWRQVLLVQGCCLFVCLFSVLFAVQSPALRSVPSWELAKGRKAEGQAVRTEAMMEGRNAGRQEGKEGKWSKWVEICPEGIQGTSKQIPGKEKSRPKHLMELNCRSSWS